MKKSSCRFFYKSILHFFNLIKLILSKVFLTKIIVIHIWNKDILLFMVLKVKCTKHKKIKFTIPQSIDEAVELNSFPQIKEMSNHLQSYPKCKMIRSLDFE
jgi:hypothetical protein